MGCKGLFITRTCFHDGSYHIHAWNLFNSPIKHCLVIVYTYHEKLWAATWENRIFAYAKAKTQISFAVTTKLISAFVFATWIIQSLSFLNPKFQVSCHLLWLYSPVCVGPGRKPRRPVFWRFLTSRLIYLPYNILGTCNNLKNPQPRQINQIIWVLINYF